MEEGLEYKRLNVPLRIETHTHTHKHVKFRTNSLSQLKTKIGQLFWREQPLRSVLRRLEYEVGHRYPVFAICRTMCV